MAVTLSVRRSLVVGVALNRKRPDFTERKRLLLTLVRPHLVQSYKNTVAWAPITQVERLTVRAVSDQGRIVLLFSEQVAAAPSGSLQALGLTLREAEVLTWVARGRTNLEIARLLTMSARTVQKHLEHVFQKLGVENRTAAAARVWETLETPK